MDTILISHKIIIIIIVNSNDISDKKYHPKNTKINRYFAKGQHTKFAKGDSQQSPWES